MYMYNVCASTAVPSGEDQLYQDQLVSFKWLINSETRLLAVLMNRPLNQLTHSIHSKTWIYSVTKHHCVLRGDTQQFCCDFDCNYFRWRN